MKHRIFSAVICAALILSALASCADSNEKDPIVDPTETKEAEKDVPVFEEADLGGRTITFVCYPDDTDWFPDNYIDNDEMNGEPMNDAVIERNDRVKEKYNCEIVKRQIEGPAAYTSTASKSGTVDFDITYDWGTRLSEGILEGLYYDLNSVDYVDLSQSYWAPSTHEDLTVADKLCLFTNDITMNRLGYSYLLVFNKTLIERYNLETPYDLVEQNRWTFDKYFEMIKDIHEDVNGNTESDAEDIFGADVCNVGMALDCAGMPLDYVVKNEDGSYKLNVYTEKLVQIYNEYAAKIEISEGVFRGFCDEYDSSLYKNPEQQVRKTGFGSGHLVFMAVYMAYTEDFCEMTDDYGVVPYPKYNDAQQEYYSFIEPYAPMFGIVRQSPSLDDIGIVLEYMAYESENLLLPAFYEQTIKNKRMNDERDDKMLDIVRDTAHYITYRVYERGGKDGEWEPISGMLSDMLSSGNFGSVNKKYKDTAQQWLNDFYDSMLTLDLNK